ncbi:uncharacterized protein LOC144700730 [Wolffia australiana]
MAEDMPSFRLLAKTEAFDRTAEEQRSDRTNGDDDFEFCSVSSNSFEGFKQACSSTEQDQPSDVSDGGIHEDPTAGRASSDLHGVPSDTYCEYPPPRLRKKSRSTGTCSMKWGLSSLVHCRSHSQGKEKLGLLSSSGDMEKIKNHTKKNSKIRSSELDLGTAHRIFYADRARNVDERRRSFLPYRQDLLSIFAS